MSPAASARLQQALLLIGPIASGKSTFGHLLSVELSWPLLSFGTYVRDQAERRGIPLDSRDELERLGARLIIAHGHDRLLRDLLAAQDSVEQVVLEGVRHIDMLQAVRRLYPAVTSVYLDVGSERRYERWLLREGRAATAASRTLFDGIAQGEVERHVYSLIGAVDHVVDGERPVNAIVQEIRRLLSGE